MWVCRASWSPSRPVNRGTFPEGISMAQSESSSSYETCRWRRWWCGTRGGWPSGRHRCVYPTPHPSYRLHKEHRQNDRRCPTVRLSEEPSNRSSPDLVKPAPWPLAGDVSEFMPVPDEAVAYRTSVTELLSLVGVSEACLSTSTHIIVPTRQPNASSENLKRAHVVRFGKRPGGSSPGR